MIPNPTHPTLHYGYEKAGVKVDNQPIPWNAEALLVEAKVRLPASGRSRDDLSLHIPDSKPISPESLHRDESGDGYRIFFRMPNPEQEITASLYWRDTVLGTVDIPILTRQQFIAGISIQMPTITVNLGEESVACLSYVSGQSKGLMATALIQSQTSLVPILDLNLFVAFAEEKGNIQRDVPIRMTSSQLHGRQTLLTVTPHKMPKRTGPWITTWHLEGEPLAMQRVRALTKRQFEKSLRISETRYIVEDHSGRVTLERKAPDLDNVARIGPCFLISSGEIGMAGMCTLQARAIIPGAVQSPLLMEHELLVTDGATPFTPGTIDVADLEQVEGFELSLNNQKLGMLPLAAAPRAHFTNEGGFEPTLDFTWSSAADDELGERLARLMGGKE